MMCKCKKRPINYLKILLAQGEIQEKAKDLSEKSKRHQAQLDDDWQYYMSEKIKRGRSNMKSYTMNMTNIGEI